MGIKVHPDWWKTLFDGMYLRTDARSVCDDDLTNREVDVICDLLKLRKGDSLLDLCGGQGRHSLALAQRGYDRCTVIDFSPHLVAMGRKSAREGNNTVRFIQGDARDTGLARESFDHVIIMGNSLGYLPEADDDARIMAEAFRVLKPGAGIMVDVTDGERVLSEMVPNAWHVVDEDLVVCREREVEDGTVRAREMIFSRRKGLVRDQAYAIRLFRTHQLEELLERAGFGTISIRRDFSPHDAEGDYGFMNRRIIATGLKPA
ncbi:MAG: class I SAM-dependent methyltransferase [bacterium]|nr:MAG: class I SAM-dependent methyltransferase [bacterium]